MGCDDTTLHGTAHTMSSSSSRSLSCNSASLRADTVLAGWVAFHLSKADLNPAGSLPSCLARRAFLMRQSATRWSPPQWRHPLNLAKSDGPLLFCLPVCRAPPRGFDAWFLGLAIAAAMESILEDKALIIDWYCYSLSADLAAMGSSPSTIACTRFA